MPVDGFIVIEIDFSDAKLLLLINSRRDTSKYLIETPFNRLNDVSTDQYNIPVVRNKTLTCDDLR